MDSSENNTTWAGQSWEEWHGIDDATELAEARRERFKQKGGIKFIGTTASSTSADEGPGPLHAVPILPNDWRNLPA